MSLAAAGLVVAIVSLGVSLYRWRAEGPRLDIEAELLHSAADDALLIVTAWSKGRAPIQIVELQVSTAIRTGRTLNHDFKFDIGRKSTNDKVPLRIEEGNHGKFVARVTPGQLAGCTSVSAVLGNRRMLSVPLIRRGPDGV